MSFQTSFTLLPLEVGVGKLRPGEVKCLAQAGWGGWGAGRRSSPGSALGDVSPDKSGTLTVGGDVLHKD